MKKLATLLLTGVVTLGVGAGLILGNSLIASRAMAAGMDAENPAIIFSDEDPEHDEGAQVVKDGLYTTSVAPLTERDGVTSLFQTLENGVTIMVQYSYGENGAKAILTRTPLSGEPDVQVFEGNEADAMIKRYADQHTDVPKYIYKDGQPGASDIAIESAIDTATKELIERYALKQEVLDRFTITPKFYRQYEDLSVPVWWINFYPTKTDEFTEIGCYTAILDASTGEALRLLSAADGKG